MEKISLIKGWLLILLGALLLSVPAGYESGHFAKWLFATSFIHSLAWSTVLLLLIDRNHRLKQFFFSILFLLFFLETACYLLFDSRVNETVLTIIMQTDLQEAQEFVGSYLFSWRLGVIVVVGFGMWVGLMRLVVALRLGPLFHTWWNRLLALGLVVAGLVLPHVRLPWTIGFNTVEGLSHAIEFVDDSHSDIDQIARMLDDIVITDSPQESDAPVIVFVIGESYNKYHSQLYGYPLQTTPHLSAEQHLVTFQHARTPVCFTHSAMRYIFSLKSCDLQEDDSLDFVLFPAVFKKAGYRVGYFDNQYTRLKVGFMDYGCGYFLSPQAIHDACFNLRNTSIEKFDGDFVRRYSSQFFKAPKSLNIIHLMGQHSDANKRYPAGFGSFMASDISREDLDEGERQLVADYDNATLYNDEILHRIIDAFRDQDAVLVYLSDHGENVYDGPHHRYGRDAGALRDEESMKYIREIPFLIWCSESFVEKRPALYEHIRQCAHRPLCSDDVAYLLFDLGGIAFNRSNPARSVLNEHYHSHTTAVE